MKKTKLIYQPETNYLEVIEGLFSDSNQLSHIRHYSNSIYIVLSLSHKTEWKPRVIEHDQSNWNLINPSQDFVNTESLNNQSLSMIFNDTLTQLNLSYQSASQTTNLLQQAVTEVIDKSHIREMMNLNDLLIHLEMDAISFNEVTHYILENTDLSNDSLNNRDFLLNILFDSSQITKQIALLQERVKSVIDIANTYHSNRLNEIMKRLSLITLSLSIPTFFTSFYGMNVKLPFSNFPLIYIFIIIISIISTLVVLYVFYSKEKTRN